jgi:hypothetical protein
MTSNSSYTEAYQLDTERKWDLLRRYYTEAHTFYSCKDEATAEVELLPLRPKTIQVTPGNVIRNRANASHVEREKTILKKNCPKEKQDDEQRDKKLGYSR